MHLKKPNDSAFEHNDKKIVKHFNDIYFDMDNGGAMIWNHIFLYIL